jgi:hypothetical protein
MQGKLHKLIASLILSGALIAVSSIVSAVKRVEMKRAMMEAASKNTNISWAVFRRAQVDVGKMENAFGVNFSFTISF